MPAGFQLDHVFVCVSSLADSVKLLTNAGLECGARSTHAGQGTANAVFFFDNAYFELLGVRDEAELESPAVRKLGLGDRLRWKESGACPFGVAFRRMGPAQSDGPGTWDYPAPFLPGGATIPIITPVGLTMEPLLFISLVSAPPVSYSHERGIPLEHKGNRHVLERVRIAVPHARLSSNALQVAGTGLVDLRPAASNYRMELQFDCKPKEALNFQPDLPLSICWAVSTTRR